MGVLLTIGSPCDGIAESLRVRQDLTKRLSLSESDDLLRARYGADQLLRIGARVPFIVSADPDDWEVRTLNHPGDGTAKHRVAARTLDPYTVAGSDRCCDHEQVPPLACRL